MGKVVVLGGSGIHDSPAFENLEQKTIETEVSNGYGYGIVPYQERIDGVIFIPRHGNGKETYSPSRTQYAANLVAAKMLGAKVVIATSAVGSLKNDINIKSLVIPKSYIDETGRDDNLFGIGIVIHANPTPAFSEEIRQILYKEATKDPDCFTKIHPGGIYITIPGDRFGTSAEGKKDLNTLILLV